MEDMTKSELVVLLEVLADLIEAKAKTPEEAAQNYNVSMDYISGRYSDRNKSDT